MEAPPPEPPKQGMVWLKFMIPASWRPELREAAAANGIAQADVCRMALRGFLSGRYGH